MSSSFDSVACDAEAARLLPWFVTGSLSATDNERVARHLERCAICRADLAHERTLRAVLKTDGSVEYAPQAGLAQTLARIDELARESSAAPRDGPAAHAGRLPRHRNSLARWLTAAVVVQAIGLGVLGGSVVMRTGGDRASARYETLTSPASVAEGTRIRAVFARTMTIGELRTLLATQRLLILAGPSDAGVFTLAATDGTLDRVRLDALLATLRADSHVLFAEPAIGDAVAPR